jgi:hypothetical protein
MGVVATILIYFLIKRIRQAHFSWHANILSLLGLPWFSYLLLRSRLAYEKGTVNWKGRTYAPPQPGLESQSQLRVASEEPLLTPALKHPRRSGL